MNAKTNDRLRQRIPRVQPPDLLTMTRGVALLGDEAVAAIFQKVKDFKDFNQGNDPYNEHDFGSFDYAGEKIFWKIDDYNGQEGYNLVITIMLAEEY